MSIVRFMQYISYILFAGLEVQQLTYIGDPKLVNNLFIFFQALKRKISRKRYCEWSEIGKSGPR